MSNVEPMLESAAPSESAGGTDLLRVLEDRITGLVDRHREARKRIGELQTRLDASEARAAALSDSVAAAGRLRDELRDRIGRVLARVEAIERVDGGEACPP